MSVRCEVCNATNSQENPVNETDLTWEQFKAAKPREGDTVKREITYRGRDVQYTETAEFKFGRIEGSKAMAEGGQYVYGTSGAVDTTKIVWSILKRTPREEPPYGTVIPLRNEHFEGYYIRTANGWDVLEKALNSPRGYSLCGQTWWQVQNSDRIVWDDMRVPE